ncbi:hypothetical protein T05_16061, partial [Trichinella murrelli]
MTHALVTASSAPLAASNRIEGFGTRLKTFDPFITSSAARVTAAPVSTNILHLSPPTEPSTNGIS